MSLPTFSRLGTGTLCTGMVGYTKYKKEGWVKERKVREKEKRAKGRQRRVDDIKEGAGEQIKNNLEILAVNMMYDRNVYFP